MRARAATLLVGLVAVMGCYHATIETGAKPSTVVIEKRWASGWIFGLVPPKTIETAAKCSTGVAKVETKLSFLNQLVSFLTLSIYTPMEIVVTCAEGMEPAPTSMMIPDSASTASWQAALAAAADQSATMDAPVYVRVSASTAASVHAGLPGGGEDSR
ncbi:MAG: Bor family protein [Gemmatimonadota bacterium]